MEKYEGIIAWKSMGNEGHRIKIVECEETYTGATEVLKYL